MEAIRSSETSVLTRVTRCHIPEDVLFNKYCFFLTSKYTVSVSKDLTIYIYTYHVRRC
jgi:hypothetical protein